MKEAYASTFATHEALLRIRPGPYTKESRQAVQAAIFDVALSLFTAIDKVLSVATATITGLMALRPTTKGSQRTEAPPRVFYTVRLPL